MLSVRFGRDYGVVVIAVRVFGIDRLAGYRTLVFVLKAAGAFSQHLYSLSLSPVGTIVEFFLCLLSGLHPGLNPNSFLPVSMGKGQANGQLR